MNINLVLYYEVRLEKYLNKILNGSASNSPNERIKKTIELYTNVLRAKNIKPSEWGSLAYKKKQPSPGFLQFIQVDHLLEMAKQAIALLDPEHPAFEILKNGLEAHASKISEQQRANASQPRRDSPYKEQLKEIISANINITEKELLKELKNVVGDGVIESIDFEQKIIRAYDNDDKLCEYSMNGLKDHLRKIRDKMI